MKAIVKHDFVIDDVHVVYERRTTWDGVKHRITLIVAREGVFYEESVSLDLAVRRVCAQARARIAPAQIMARLHNMTG